MSLEDVIRCGESSEHSTRLEIGGQKQTRPRLRFLLRDSLGSSDSGLTQGLSGLRRLASSVR